jgi:cytidine diphosphoramidate kinase
MSKKIKKIKKKGYIFWITGLPGSGKSTLGKAIHKKIQEEYGPTLLFNGDDLRNIFEIRSYEKKKRILIGKQYTRFCDFIAKQNINVIFTVVALFENLHAFNRSKLDNYIEIYIHSDLKKIIKNKKRIFYIKKTSNVWGLDIKPEYPKNPHIKIDNKFNKDINYLKNRLLNKLKKIL